MDKIIIFIVSVFLIGLTVAFYIFIQKLKKRIKEYNEINKELKEKQNELNSIKIVEKEKQDRIETLSDKLVLLQKNLDAALENSIKTSQMAFENYSDVLDQEYKEKEKEWDNYAEEMQTAYSDLQQKLIDETEEYRKELEKLKETRSATLQAIVREKEIEEKLAFYCLQISDKDLADVKLLEEIKSKLNNERILCMLIWQTFFQKPMNTLCANIIGTKTKCGIYKITNQKTKECYIGQAVNIADRWKQHAKCGLGIDTPVGNKLYKAIKEYGIWNFSWEVIEECPSAQLNEKEKYYISLYDSYNYGYNSNRGNS